MNGGVSVVYKGGMYAVVINNCQILVLLWLCFQIYSFCM